MHLNTAEEGHDKHQHSCVSIAGSSITCVLDPGMHIDNVTIKTKHVDYSPKGNNELKAGDESENLKGKIIVC